MKAVKIERDGKEILVEMENGVQIVLDSSAAAEIRKICDMKNYKQDIIQFFEDNSETYNVEAVLADEPLITSILEHYTDLRTQALESWYESLESSVRAHKECLGKYRNTKRLHVSMAYTFVGDTGIDIPASIIAGKPEEEQLEIAFEYAKEHVNEINVATNASYVADSEVFELEDVNWEGK